jgi:hypothetical protein
VNQLTNGTETHALLPARAEQLVVHQAQIPQPFSPWQKLGPISEQLGFCLLKRDEC